MTRAIITDRFRTLYNATAVAGDDSQLNAYVAEWEAIKRDNGEHAAVAAFWRFIDTLPRAQRSDCDPDGN